MLAPGARRLPLPHVAGGGPRVGGSIGVLGGEGGLGTHRYTEFPGRGLGRTVPNFWYCHHQHPGLSESLPVCLHRERQHPCC